MRQTELCGSRPQNRDMKKWFITFASLLTNQRPARTEPLTHGVFWVCPIEPETHMPLGSRVSGSLSPDWPIQYYTIFLSILRTPAQTCVWVSAWRQSDSITLGSWVLLCCVASLQPLRPLNKSLQFISSQNLWIHLTKPSKGGVTKSLSSKRPWVWKVRTNV